MANDKFDVDYPVSSSKPMYYITNTGDENCNYIRWISPDFRHPDNDFPGPIPSKGLIKLNAFECT